MFNGKYSLVISSPESANAATAGLSSFGEIVNAGVTSSTIIKNFAGNQNLLT